MASKRPSRLKIGLHHYPVKWSKNPMTQDGQEVGGYIHYQNDNKHIVVGIGENNTSTPDEVLLREMTHGICYDRALGELFQSDEAEEMFVSSFARGLLAAFRENKGLLEWLAAERSSGGKAKS